MAEIDRKFSGLSDKQALEKFNLMMNEAVNHPKSVEFVWLKEWSGCFDVEVPPTKVLIAKEPDRTQ